MTHAATLPSRAAERARISGNTWPLFAVAVTLTVALNWITNEFLLTPEVYGRLLGDQLDASRIEAQIDLLQTTNLVGYAAAPVVVWLRLAFVASLLHMICLVSTLEIRWRDTFRICLIAFGAPLMATAMRVVMLWSVGVDDITTATLQVTPGSLASLILDPPVRPSVTYAAVSMISVQELLWAVAIGAGLRQIAGVRVGVAAGVAAGLWALLAILQLGLILLVAATAA